MSMSRNSEMAAFTVKKMTDLNIGSVSHPKTPDTELCGLVDHSIMHLPKRLAIHCVQEELEAAEGRSTSL